MRYSNLLTAALATGLTAASPIQKRDALNDFDILNYALTLEFLERKFYAEGLANYSAADFTAAGFDDEFHANLVEVATDERTHVDFLTTAITAAGGKPVHEATYAFPSTDAKSFIALASVLEGVGTSAYLGAAGAITDKDYLTAAGAILTVEARHSAYIRAALKESPFPNAFDTPLDFNEVYSLASAFITGFDSADGALPFKAFPALALTCEASYYTANVSSLTFTGAAKTYPDMPLFAAFFSGVTPAFVPVVVAGDDLTAEIPFGVSGQSYVVLSKNGTAANDDTTVAGPAIFEAYTAGKEPTTPAPACA